LYLSTVFTYKEI